MPEELVKLIAALREASKQAVICSHETAVHFSLLEWSDDFSELADNLEAHLKEMK